MLADTQVRGWAGVSGHVLWVTVQEGHQRTPAN